MDLDPVVEAFLVACIPAASMMFGSLLMLLVPSVNPKFQATMQNLSAGIILAAVSTELFPLLDVHGGQSDTSVWGLAIGFVTGMAGLFGVKRFLDYAEGLGSEEEQSLISSESPFYGGGNSAISLDVRACNPDDLLGKFKRVTAVLMHMQDHLKRQVPDRFAVDRHVHEILHHLEDARRFLRGEQKLMAPEQIQLLAERLVSITNQVEESGQQVEAGGLNPTDMDLKITKLAAALKPLLSNKRGVFRRWDVSKPSPLGNVSTKEKIPWGQWIAVVIDAFVDGFLIGLAYIAEPRAGLVMGGATCIEMGFLGLTFAARSKQVTPKLWKFLGLVLSPPAALCIGSFLGANLASSVTDYPAVFVGFIAFSIVALLFLVTQELLIEAFENTDSEGLWYVNIWLFIGIFIVLISEKIQ
jgi:zinc transporter ZupT